MLLLIIAVAAPASVVWSRWNAEKRRSPNSIKTREKLENGDIVAFLQIDL